MVLVCRSKLTLLDLAEPKHSDEVLDFLAVSLNLSLTAVRTSVNMQFVGGGGRYPSPQRLYHFRMSYDRRPWTAPWEPEPLILHTMLPQWLRAPCTYGPYLISKKMILWFAREAGLGQIRTFFITFVARQATLM